MKIILSRKGFDSAAGGYPSPIFIDENRIVSFPIPEDIDGNRFVHLDPDICFDVFKNRKSNWKGIFGQCSSAQSHLSNP